VTQLVVLLSLLLVGEHLLGLLDRLEPLLGVVVVADVRVVFGGLLAVRLLDLLLAGVPRYPEDVVEVIAHALR